MKLITALLFSFVACSATAQTQYVNATVTDVYPVYQYVPVVECQTVRVPRYRVNTGDVAAGAIIGGVVGNQFGHGDGKTAMTVLGMVLGANIASQPRLKMVAKQQCVTYNRQELVSYEVQYFWNGFRSKMISPIPYNVGDYIVVSVTLN